MGRAGVSVVTLLSARVWVVPVLPIQNRVSLAPDGLS